MARDLEFRILEVEDCTKYVAKTKALISCAVIAQLICTFVFAYAKSRFSHDAAHIFQLFQMEEFEKSSQVSLYLHMQEEVSTTTILKRVLAANKQCFIPYYKGLNN